MINLNEKELLFYDIEVFKHNAFVVFKNINKETVAVFHNDFDGIWDVVKDKTLVSFNGHHYDDKILTGMLNCNTPEQLKHLNDRIILNGEKCKTDMRLNTLDVYQQISVSKPGLKKIEGNMGKMILETSVGFDIDRPLTESEYQAELKYCMYDVDMVIEIWKLRQDSYFLPKKALLERYGNNRAVNWNTTTISANLLLDKPMAQWSSLRVDEDILNLVPLEVKEMWLQANNIGAAIKTKTKTINEFGNKIVFGFGGLHGAKSNCKRFENVILCDITSYYPSMIINLGVLGAATDTYKSILEERVRIKHTEPILQEALKLILNSVYGQLNSKYSMLYNTRALYSICVYGQAVIYELSKRLSLAGDIIQINTDGVMFSSDSEVYKEICSTWEKEFKLGLEFENIDLLIQRDVNNYIAVQGDKITCKGGDVGKYNYNKYFDNNNTRIIDIAIVDYLVYGKDVLDTITENLDKPILFQYILQAGRTYEGTFDRQGNEYNRVNRIFASKESNPDKIELLKKRADNGLDKFANAPTDMIIWNDEVDKLENFKDIVDINWYYKLIQDKLQAWE